MSLLFQVNFCVAVRALSATTLTRRHPSFTLTHAVTPEHLNFQIRAVSTHPNIGKSMSRQRPVDSYRAMVARGQLREDSHQLAALESLSEVHSVICEMQRNGHTLKLPKPRHLLIGGNRIAEEEDSKNTKKWMLRKIRKGVVGLNRTFRGVLASVRTKDGEEDPWDREPVTSSALSAARELMIPNKESEGADAAYAGKKPGIYIHGEVGCGKTMIMDLFFHSLPIEKKRRIHLAAFLGDIHRRMHILTEQCIKDKTEKGKWPRERLLDIVAADIANESWVICFDEFQVIDIGDASILTSLFTLLFSYGVVVVATSNKTPDTLYHVNDQFAKFVNLLHRHCIVHELQRTRDFRLTGNQSQRTYLCPDTAESRAKIYQIFKDLTTQPVLRNVDIPHSGRILTVPFTKGPVALFPFEYICGDLTALGPSDYAAIARAFHTVCIISVPIMGLYNRDASRRFITLVDELYQYKVKLVCTASAMPFEIFNYDFLSEAAARERAEHYFADMDDKGLLGRNRSSTEQQGYDKRFTGEDELFSFKRVESRLMEMMTVDYIRLQHLLFITEDVNLELLIGTDVKPEQEWNKFVEVQMTELATMEGNPCELRAEQ